VDIVAPDGKKMASLSVPGAKIVNFHWSADGLFQDLTPFLSGGQHPAAPGVPNKREEILKHLVLYDARLINKDELDVNQDSSGSHGNSHTLYSHNYPIPLLKKRGEHGSIYRRRI